MRHLALSLAAAAGFAAGPPAVAQTLDELTITGHGLRSQPQSLSETVSYADLDLTSRRDRHRLAERVNVTAQRLCDRLNEPPPSPGNLGHSCQEIAVRDAMGQVRQAYADARIRGGWAYADARARGGRAYSAGAYAFPASARVSVVTNGPVPDTPENRARYGGPMSRAGQRTGPRGN
jgi:UrcA family protein